MLPTNQIEQLITLVSSLDRESLLRQFEQYPATFPVDFMSDFLKRQPLERLRHLFVAMCLQSQRMPQLQAEESVAAA